TVKQMQADGVLGKMIYAEADYWHPLKKEYPSYPWAVGKENGGSAFISAGCHAADAIRYFAGEVTEVAAFSAGPKKDLNYEYDPATYASYRSMALCFAIDASAAKDGARVKVDYEVMRGAGAAAGS